jgi:hypothetical protein
MKYKINIKRRKKEKTPKKMAPTGAVALEAGRVSIGLARGVHLYCVINCI